MSRLQAGLQASFRLGSSIRLRYHRLFTINTRLAERLASFFLPISYPSHPKPSKSPPIPQESKHHKDLAHTSGIKINPAGIPSLPTTTGIPHPAGIPEGIPHPAGIPIPNKLLRKPQSPQGIPYCRKALSPHTLEREGIPIPHPTGIPYPYPLPVKTPFLNPLLSLYSKRTEDLEPRPSYRNTYQRIFGARTLRRSEALGTLWTISFGSKTIRKALSPHEPLKIRRIQETHPNKHYCS